MYGKNDVAGVRSQAAGFLVHSIFYTIQGEGPWAGKPTIFVRFAGCNLRCFFCDTDFAGGTHYTTKDLAHVLMQASLESKCLDFVLTGGEPMLQPLTGLIQYMNAIPSAYRFQVETAGTVWPVEMETVMNRGVLIVCSPKTPKVHAQIEKYASAWKYIIMAGDTDPEDGLPIRSTQTPGGAARIFRPNYKGAVYVQPCDEGDPRVNTANITLAVNIVKKYGYRLSMQMHKYAGIE
jgi:organic radical activating enzyme